jgi:two-component system, OmpR family, alkaline phosphatase synthesis response regulator PhoP
VLVRVTSISLVRLGQLTTETTIMNAPLQALSQPSSSDDMDYSKSVVLVVDDNAQNVELLQAYLETLGCRVLTASDGLAAMQIVRSPDSPTPDLILLDVMMPRMSGFEVCRKLKGDPATRSIPVMMVTALNELGDIERGVESGTDDFLTKPVNKLELLTRVRSLLRVRHLKRELDRTLSYINRPPAPGISSGSLPAPGSGTEPTPGNPASP